MVCFKGGRRKSLFSKKTNMAAQLRFAQQHLNKPQDHKVDTVIQKTMALSSCSYRWLHAVIVLYAQYFYICNMLHDDHLRFASFHDLRRVHNFLNLQIL